MSETVSAAESTVRVRIGRFLFKYRDVLFPSVFALLLVFTRPRILFDSVPADRALEAAGIFVALAGQSLRAAVIGLAYIKRGGTDKKIDAPRLVREGIFALSRNPLYAGNILIVVGLTMIYNSPWGYFIAIPGFLFAYLCIVEAEEEFLRGKFGDDYRRYCAEVNRFIPSVRGARKAVQGMSFDIKRVIRKDYGTAFYWYSCALLLVAWKDIYHFGWDTTRVELLVVGAVWAAGFIAWRAARFMKKKRLLSSPDYAPPAQ